MVKVENRQKIQKRHLLELLKNGKFCIKLPVAVVFVFETKYYVRLIDTVQLLDTLESKDQNFFMVDF